MAQNPQMQQSRLPLLRLADLLILISEIRIRLETRHNRQRAYRNYGFHRAIKHRYFCHQEESQKVIGLLKSSFLLLDLKRAYSIPSVAFGHLKTAYSCHLLLTSPSIPQVPIEVPCFLLGIFLYYVSCPQIVFMSDLPLLLAYKRKWKSILLEEQEAHAVHTISGNMGRSKATQLQESRHSNKQARSALLSDGIPFLCPCCLKLKKEFSRLSWEALVQSLFFPAWKRKSQSKVLYQFLRFLTQIVDWLKVPNNAFQKPLVVELVISLSYVLSYAFGVPKDK